MQGAVDTGSVWRSGRWIVVACLALATALSWGYLGYQEWAMRNMDLVDMWMPSSDAWGATDISMILLMWIVMMIAMMLPSVLPMVLTVDRIGRQRNRSALPVTATFTAGYLTTWTLFSVAATAIQWSLHAAALMSGDMTLGTPLLAGVVLMVAGTYQLTSIKNACLSRCRSPLDFVLTEWRDGAGGAFVMGLRYGAYCTGCCWGLMLLLFALGIMNLAWVGLLTLLVLIEKTLPGGVWFARLTGLMLVAGGAAVALLG
jgi:predicted metal-binding membrane protein